LIIGIDEGNGADVGRALDVVLAAIGNIAAPHRPIMPQANIILRNDVTMSVPLACCVRPIAQSELVFGPRALHLGGAPIFSAGSR